MCALRHLDRITLAVTACQKGNILIHLPSSIFGSVTCIIALKLSYNAYIQHGTHHGYYSLKILDMSLDLEAKLAALHPLLCTVAPTVGMGSGGLGVQCGGEHHGGPAPPQRAPTPGELL